MASHYAEAPPYAAYASLLAVFGTSSALALSQARYRPPPWSDITLLGIATYKITSITAKDRVTSVVRSPFAEQRMVDGELEEEPAQGRGLRNAIGQLVTCPYCLGPWVASALLGGYAASPRWTRSVGILFSVVALADVLHLAHERLEG